MDGALVRPPAEGTGVRANGFPRAAHGWRLG